MRQKTYLYMLGCNILAMVNYTQKLPAQIAND